MSGDAQRRVRRLTHRQGPNFSLGFRMLPAVKRQAVYAAYAVCRIADDIVDEAPEDVPVAQTQLRLDAWRAEIESTYGGQPHRPATRALADVLDRFSIPKQAFFDLIEGCRWDLVKHRYETFEELERYCELVAVTISDISLAIFGTVDPRAPGFGRSLAIALQLTNVCRDVGEDAERGRIYLPLDELERFGVTQASILSRDSSPAFRRLMEFEAGRARSFFLQANPLPECIERDARLGVRLMGRVYATILDRIRKNPEAVLDRRIQLGVASRIRVLLAGFMGRPFMR